MKSVNFEAYFLGPKAENYEFYKKLIDTVFEEHIKWRRAFHSRDSVDFITEDDKELKEFKEAKKNIEEEILRISEDLKMSQPFFSPRYIGHMNWEIMYAPLIAYFLAAMFNPNNVAFAGSTATSKMELEAGKDFLRLLGMDEEKGWGHICAGGTIANIEALWIARNMKVIPVALKKLLKKYGFSPVPRTNLKDEELLKKYNPEEILNIKDEVFNILKNEGIDEKEIENSFEELSMQNTGVKNIDTGLVFMPQTKHYSLKKAIDLLGIGRENIRYVPVNNKFRMDIKILKEMIEKEKKRPVLAVIAVLGSTEESAVDEIDKIIELRKEFNKKGIGFHIHIDAAYGGYVRSIFLNENGEFFKNIEELKQKLEELKILKIEKGWPDQEVFNAFKAVSEADSVTIDPHKLGYIPYPAGGIVIRDKRMRDAIQTFAPYVFSKPQKGEPDQLIGSYILEGSKPGAAAAAVWLAHKIMPQNIYGYGKLTGETIDGALTFYEALKNAPKFKVNDKIFIKVHPLCKPDINIVNYIFNFEGNKDLEKINKLSKFIKDNILSPVPEKGKSMIDKIFIASDTSFDKKEYGYCILPFLNELGIDKKEFDKVGEIFVLRSVIMSPYLTTDYVEKNYSEEFIKYLKCEISQNVADIEKIYIGEYDK